ncbi:low temperature requirement protein A [Sphingomonas sp. SUN039]|uniref:low temperature requirement protein A n=1 Tax=Sphingomonas sp. SUN039 TaxID=2937787 RepID=UPI00216422D0|nr:low temperature requirement protein A [Sphingomonas sp. SUN039]UVO55381.1 low temperature requirement protein A [Sphingomonas sp. SUN039]
MSVETRRTLFRIRDAENSSRVTEIELFFDLVFVFAITQLSHGLVDHLNMRGALETLVLFLAVWWLWIYTSWATNWLDPERTAVRGLLMAMMLGGLVLASALPKAFGASGLVFALAYVTMQLARTLWIAWLSRGHNRARVRNFLRIAFYFLLAAPLWIAGALAEANIRLLFWAGALAIEYAGPWLFFRTPLLGRSGIDDWDISGSHMAERCALFIIIALGEAILVTGATFADLTPDAPTVTAFLVSFVGSAAMWWIYFDTGAKRGGEAIEHEAEAGRLARNAYTYLHMPIVAGIVVTAVADEMMLAHPVGHHAEIAFILVACGGPLLFLFGNQAFKYVTADRPIPPLSHFIGQALLIGSGISAWQGHWTPLTTGVAAMAALIATAAWEWFSLNGGWQRWAPWLDRRTKIALEDSER